MPTDALVLAPIIVAIVLGASAVGKLRSPSASAEAFRDLRVPSTLNRPSIVTALPVVELLLAAGLLLLSGAAGVMVAAATLALFTAYLVLVARALGFEADVSCACFGAWAPGRLTLRTVMRNSWLVVLAALAVGSALQGESVVSRVVTGQSPWWWILGAFAAATTLAVITGFGGPPPSTPPQTSSSLVEEGEYQRVRTPALPVVLADGSPTHLRHLSAARPQLLLHVSETCGSCAEVVAAVPAWRERMPAVDIRLVIRSEPGSSSLTAHTEPLSIHDPEGLIGQTFDMPATPSAVLLGADGLLAGGPVIGAYAVPEFVDDILHELSEQADSLNR